MVPLNKIDNAWTLFLDRDGVINVKKETGYVSSCDEFIFCDGALEAIGLCSAHFGKIIVVTNQRGVGRNIMTETDLTTIHEHMCTHVEREGGRIHKIYSCTAVEDIHTHRKPNIGMAQDALREFPDIDFSKSVMIGDSHTDMEFGKNIGMHTIFITPEHSEIELPHPKIDSIFDSLVSFAKAIRDAKL